MGSKIGSQEHSTLNFFYLFPPSEYERILIKSSKHAREAFY